MNRGVDAPARGGLECAHSARLVEVIAVLRPNRLEYGRGGLACKSPHQSFVADGFARAGIDDRLECEAESRIDDFMTVVEHGGGICACMVTVVEHVFPLRVGLILVVAA